jgi:glycosyltransferase involved in cell wall biosynthesis
MKIGIVSADRIHPSLTKDKSARWGGSGWARIGKYLKHLKYDHVVGRLVWHYTELKIEDDNQTLHEVDVIIMQRMMNEGLAYHVKKSREKGQIIINDVDDWYWGLDPANNAWTASHPKNNPKENINHYKSILAASDFITVSTPFLYERMSKWNKNVRMFPNTVDVDAFTKHDHTEKKHVYVGWVGSTAHRSGDLQVMRGVLSQLATTQNANAQVRYLHGGAHEKSPHFADEVGVPQELVDLLPLCEPQDYPKLLAMDIGIAPLRNMPFNEAKSEIKLLEYSASGIPWVASASSSYANLSATWGAGRIAHRPHQWLRHLRELVGSRQLRIEEGQRLYELSRTRDITHGISLWNEILSSL